MLPEKEILKLQIRTTLVERRDLLELPRTLVRMIKLVEPWERQVDFVFQFHADRWLTGSEKEKCFDHVFSTLKEVCIASNCWEDQRFKYILEVINGNEEDSDPDQSVRLFQYRYEIEL